MKFQGIRNLILASLVSVSTQACWTGDIFAGTSTPWAENEAVVEREIVPSRDLRWSKPKVAGASIRPKATVVTADHIDVTEPASIRQVQYSFAQAKPLTPAQRDTIYPEMRPQSNTPPTGATLVPSVPGNPPSSFATPSEPTRPDTFQTKRDAIGETVKPATDSANHPKPEAKAVELKTPDLQKPDNPVGIGSTPAPEPIDSYGTPRRGAINCPDQAGFKSIREISYDIRPMPGTLPTECPLVTAPYTGRHFSRTCYQWKASALCTKAAYFEDVQLERYGHSMCPFLEPVISGTRFFLTIPILPYKMGLIPPNECVYTLGHYRVGSCAPYMLDPLPISIRAALFEGAAIGGAIAIIP